MSILIDLFTKKIVIVSMLCIISVVSCGDDMPIAAHIKNSVMNTIDFQVNRFHDDEKKSVQIDVYGENTLDIDLSRLDDNMYGVKQLNNRWSMEEIDTILNSIKGTWKISDYVGFIPYKLYEPDLFGTSEVNETSKKLLSEYDSAVEKSKNKTFDFLIGIRSFGSNAGKQNSIVVKTENSSYESPISIILSMDKMEENYPIFSEQTTLSQDFTVKYPVIFIRLFLNDNNDNYLPATIVLSSDNKIYILIKGAFYKLKNANKVSGVILSNVFTKFNVSGTDLYRREIFSTEYGRAYLSVYKATSPYSLV